MKLKAYVCFSAHETPSEGCLLAFAESRNKAREMTHTDICDYLGTAAWRVKSFDAFADRRRVIFGNDELPEGAPPFFDNEPWDGTQ